MNDDTVLGWLIEMTSHIARLHAERHRTNAGPHFADGIRTVTIEEEGFARWMGWRGQAEQERETAWPAEELREANRAQHRETIKQLREDYAELRQFVLSLRSAIDQKFGK